MRAGFTAVGAAGELASSQAADTVITATAPSRIVSRFVIFVAPASGSTEAFSELTGFGERLGRWGPFARCYRERAPEVGVQSVARIAFRAVQVVPTIWPNLSMSCAPPVRAAEGGQEPDAAAWCPEEW